MIVRLFRRYATAAPTPIPITVPQSHFKKKKISNIRRVGQESSTQSHLETNIQISKCYAYCTARQYNLMLIENKILNQSEKYTVTSASMKDTSSEFLHVSVNDTADDTEFKRNFFIFKDGCLVSWNTTQAQDLHLMEKIKEAEIESFEEELRDEEEMKVILDPSGVTGMKGEDIVLRNSSSTKTKQETFLACLAFSHGLARSSQLAVLENHLEKYIDSIKNIPLYMISKGKFPNLSRAAVTKKHGHLLHIRGLLNLHTDLVDALPDYYWSRTNSAQHFQSISRALDVVPRIRVLNQRLDYAAQLVSLMKDRQSELHGSKMEYIIIALIFVEVVFETVHYLNELNYVDLKELAGNRGRPWFSKDDSGIKEVVDVV